MKRIWTLCAALLGAVLAVVPGLASAQDLTRQYSIDWQATSFKSRGSCLNTLLQSEGLPIFSVNDMPLPTYTVGPLLTRPNGDQQNRFRAVFGGSLLRWGNNDFFFGVATTGDRDYCTFAEDTVELNSSGLQPRRLFSVSRQGQPFYGVAPLTLDLREINPTLANSLAALEHAVAIEMSRVYNLGPDLATQQARAAQLKALLEEMKQLCQRPLDSITEAELNALLNKYSAVPPGVRQALLQLLTDLKKSVEELRAEIDRIVAEFRGQMDALDRWTLPKPDTSVDLENPDTYEPDLSKDQVPEVEVPDVSEDDPFDPDNDPYLAFAEATLTELNKSLSNGVVADRQGFLAMVRLWRFNQDVFERGLKSRIGVSQAEWGAFLTAQQRVLSFIRQYLDEGDWFRDSPVRESTKAFVAMLEQRPENAAQAHALKNNLNLWYGEGTPTLHQKLALDTLDALFGGFEALGEGVASEDPTIPHTLFSTLDGAITATREAAVLGMSFTPVGDFIDLCELVTGKELCNPYGNDLSVSERMYAGSGLVIGSGKFWKIVGTHVAVVGGAILSKHLPDWLELLQDISHAEKQTLLQRLGDKVLEHVKDLSGQEMYRILNRVGDDTVKKIAPHVKADGLRQLETLNVFKYHPPNDATVKNFGEAVKKLPPLKGKTMDELRVEFKSQGFGTPIQSPDGSVFWIDQPTIDGAQEIWMHRDQSVIRIATQGTKARPYPHFKKEIADRPYTFDDRRIKAKVTDRRAAVAVDPDTSKPYPLDELVPSGTGEAQDLFAQWLARHTGKTPQQVKDTMADEMTLLMKYWGDETHIPIN